MGILLGWYAFPAILVALFFQAVMFQHGGLTTLGVNATVIGVPALLAHLAFQAAKHLKVAAPGQRLGVGITGFLIGGATLLIEVLLFYGVLLLSVRFQTAVNVALEQAALTTAVVAYLPLMLLEGLFTAMVLLFLLRVSPTLLGMQPAAAAPTRAAATERPAEQGEPV
jgi:cobalt/nickel transport system permease protein